MNATAAQTPINAWYLCVQDPEQGEPERTPAGFNRHDAVNALNARLLKMQAREGYLVELFGIQHGAKVFSAERGSECLLLWVEPEETLVQHQHAHKLVWN